MLHLQWLLLQSSYLGDSFAKLWKALVKS
jgi:hypothetical protein